MAGTIISQTAFSVTTASSDGTAKHRDQFKTNLFLLTAKVLGYHALTTDTVTSVAVTPTEVVHLDLRSCC